MKLDRHFRDRALLICGVLGVIIGIVLHNNDDPALGERFVNGGLLLVFFALFFKIRDRHRGVTDEVKPKNSKKLL